MSAVGKYYRGPHDGYVSPFYYCESHDPSCGYWMQMVGGERRTNISECAIDRTFHEVHDTPRFYNECVDLIRHGNTVRRVMGIYGMACACSNHLKHMELLAMACDRVNYLTRDPSGQQLAHIEGTDAYGRPLEFQDKGETKEEAEKALRELDADLDADPDPRNEPGYGKSIWR